MNDEDDKEVTTELISAGQAMHTPFYPHFLVRGKWVKKGKREAFNLFLEKFDEDMHQAKRSEITKAENANVCK